MLIFFHSLVRWLVLVSLLYGLVRSARGFSKRLPFTKADDAARHWTATIAHIQMMIGITIFVQSPLVKYFWANASIAVRSPDLLFFGLVHVLLMLTAIVVITIGSALAKRRLTSQEKFRTMFIWFSVALLIIFIAIPWPFSPLASRPYLRSF